MKWELGGGEKAEFPGGGGLAGLFGYGAEGYGAGLLWVFGGNVVEGLCGYGDGEMALRWGRLWAGGLRWLLDEAVVDS